jgi:beta-lactamase regulating signal transducer with metallopeptidase domain
MTIVERVGWVLLHFVWQGSVIALALAILLALTRESQARLRYTLSCAALVLMLAATLATAATLIRDSAGGAVRDGAATGPSGSSQLTPAASAGQRADHTASMLARVGPSPITGGAEVNTASLVQPIIDRVMPWLVLAWLAGVLLLSIRLLGGWWSTRALRVVGVSPVPEWCLAQLRALSKRMGIARRVAIVSSVRITVPVIVGHLKPVIVLPAAALSGLTATQVEAILAHELAHVRRHDYLVNLAQTVIETLLFYHPAVWWVSRQVRETREHCCDDLAVAVCRSRREYVSALIDLEELRGSTPALALAATDGSLLARGRRCRRERRHPASRPV